MATYRGHVRTRQDAILLFEACQLNVLPKILRRLSRKERKVVISPGAVFVWDEAEAGIQRWTDGRLWGSITLSEEFIIRREMERKARRPNIIQESTPMDVEGDTSRRGSDGDIQMEEGIMDDYKYKTNGLTRRSMTITSNGRQLHLVTYDDPTCGYSPELPSPTTDSLLKHLIEEKIAARSCATFPRAFNDPRFMSESLQGGSVLRPPAVIETHFNDFLPASQQMQALSNPSRPWGIPRGQINHWNDAVTNLYMLLASFSQSPPNIPQHLSHHPPAADNWPPGVSTRPPPFATPTEHTRPIQMVHSPPSPPRSPKLLHAASPPAFVPIQPAKIDSSQSNSYHYNLPKNAIEILSITGTPGRTDVQPTSCPPCSSLPMPEVTPETADTQLSAQEESFRALGKFGDTRWEDGRRRDISHQTLKVHRDDERVVRSLDKRFLTD